MADNTTNSGIGFFGLLCILFIGLKLTNNIEWSWFWVLFPITFPFVVSIIFILIGLTFKFFDRNKGSK
jgi:hypothetical protein